MAITGITTNIHHFRTLYKTWPRSSFRYKETKYEKQNMLFIIARALIIIKQTILLHLYLHTSILNLKIQNMEKSCVWIRVSSRTNERLISRFSQFCTLAWPIQLLYCYFLKINCDFGGIKQKSRWQLYSRTFVILLPPYRPLQSTGFAGSYRNKSLLYRLPAFERTNICR